MSDNKLLDWAVSVIAEAPPLQNVVAFIIVLLLAAPLVRAGLREFKSKTIEPHQPKESIPVITVDPGWLYTTLINTDLKIERLTKDLAAVSGQLAAIDKILRRRAARAKK